MPAWRICSGVTKSGSPTPSEITSGMVLIISKNLRIPEGFTERTRCDSSSRFSVSMDKLVPSFWKLLRQPALLPILSSTAICQDKDSFQHLNLLTASHFTVSYKDLNRQFKLKREDQRHVIISLTDHPSEYQYNLDKSFPRGIKCIGKKSHS